MKTIRVAAAIIHSKDYTGAPVIFATQRGYGPWKDYWEFPGGKIEEGETPEEALHREIREELKTEITVERKLTTVEYDYPEFHLSMDCFLSHITQGSPVLTEHEAARWLRKEQLRDVNWLPADLQLIAEIEKAMEQLSRTQPAFTGEKPDAYGIRSHDEQENDTFINHIQLINDDYLGYTNRLRHACRGLLLRDGKVLLIYESKTGKYIIPGGGLEEGETLEKCCEREMLEETGIIVRAVRYYLEIEELFEDWRHINHYFVCEFVRETGSLHLTEDETRAGYTSVWLPVREAAELFGDYEKFHRVNIADFGLYRREYTALAELVKILD